MTSLTYREYYAWFLRTYGRPFAANEAEFEAALRADYRLPTDDLGPSTGARLQADLETDAAVERREGWGYQ